MMIFNINPISAALFQLYILQLDEYDIFRFLKKLPKVKKGKKLVKSLVWTTKIKLIYLLSFFQILLISWLIANLNLFFFGFVLFVGLQLFFIPLVLSVIILFPIDYVFKKIIIQNAKIKIKKHTNLKIIAIAGSYGKTTFKEILYTILSQKHKVLRTPENINTPIGISRLINKTLNDSHEILIVEMGEYFRGDIKNLCQITQPDISVVTGINEAHYERLKNMETTISTIFEVVKYAKKDALIVLNSDDKNIIKNYQNEAKALTNLSNDRYTKRLVEKSKKIIFYGKNDSKIYVKNIILDTQNLKTDFELFENKKFINSYSIPIIAEYGVYDLVGAIEIALELKMPWSFINQGIKKIKPVPHRLNVKYNQKTNITIIDDTYNTNPEGLKYAINLLKQFNGRKIYITPGMAEAGTASKDIHTDLAKMLTEVADMVILIKTSSSMFILEGLKKYKFNNENIKIYNHQQEVYDDMDNFSKSGDVILFQNIWPESYV